MVVILGMTNTHCFINLFRLVNSNIENFSAEKKRTVHAH